MDAINNVTQRASIVLLRITGQGLQRNGALKGIDLATGSALNVINNTDQKWLCNRASTNSIIIEGSWMNQHTFIANKLYPLGFEKNDNSLPLATAVTQLISASKPALKYFMLSLMSSETWDTFLKVPASRHYHHDSEGGLFRHSVECAIMASQLAFTWLPREEAEITVYGALLHDIGKTRTISGNGRRTDTGVIVDHDSMTLEVLTPHLYELESRWRQGAIMLRAILTKQKSKGGFYTFPGTQIVNAVDQLSTMCNRRKKMFAQKPFWYKAAFDSDNNQQYIRL